MAWNAQIPARPRPGPIAAPAASAFALALALSLSFASAPGASAQADGAQALALYRSGDYTAAARGFGSAAEAAEASGRAASAARLLINQGHSRSAARDDALPAPRFTQALSGRRAGMGANIASADDDLAAGAVFRRAAGLAAEARSPALEAESWTHALRASRAASGPALLDTLDRAGDRLGALEAAPPRALAGLLAEGAHAAAALPATPASGPLFLSASQRLAARPDLSHEEAGWASGASARHLFLAGREDEARAATRAALRHALLAGSARQQFLWQAQLGHSDRARGASGDAVISFRRAMDALAVMSVQARGGGRAERAFNEEEVQPAATALVQTLLEEGRTVEAMDALAELRRLELSDFLGETCRAADSAVPVAYVEPGAVLLATVTGAEGTDILIASGDTVIHRRSPLVAGEAAALSSQLLQTLQEPGSTAYRVPAAALHDALIAPVSADLDALGAHTVVFSLDGPLRSVPPAAFWDGSAHFAETRGAAMAADLFVPGAAPLSDESGGALFLGVSDAVAGFSALPAVESELSTVSALIDGPAFLNEGFTSDSIREQAFAADPRILHLATHAEFKGTLEASYVLAHDGKIPMARFSETVARSAAGGRPLDLIVLSACETAEGSGRAALGIAGVAIQSGAQSALGSLWKIDDTATSAFQAAFYRRLAAGEGRADAVRGAQNDLLADPATAHPYFWAPFILAGNWK